MRDRPRNGLYLPPFVLQLIGVAVLIAAVVFWFLTGRSSALIVGAAITLMAMGAYSSLHVTVKQEVDENRRRRAEDEPEEEEPWTR